MKIDFRVFERPTFSPFAFLSSKECYDYLHHYSAADREMFILLFLNPKNNVIKEEISSIGTVNQAVVFPREVFKSALMNNASSIICAHNHTTGDVSPSPEVMIITKRLVFGGQFLDIKILDHIIVGKDKYFSFADEGLIGDYESKYSL